MDPHPWPTALQGQALRPAGMTKWGLRAGHLPIWDYPGTRLQTGFFVERKDRLEFTAVASTLPPFLTDLLAQAFSYQRNARF